ncbi:hypothetical protein J2R98_000163 [Alkalibacillus filiformis]|uniref:Uncharacterized protein n=1 Tax=Alkalibacillus filiformis TaxID=200990 RepID=A0ABU0DPR4_9BACI|nr:hypothetical protein [Alkalibacillus filiformis]MDQ0350360.1 hypothetical protein [Alkalibacillus filiformis]
MYYAILLNAGYTPKGNPKKIYLVYETIENGKLELIETITADFWGGISLKDKYPYVAIINEFQVVNKEYKFYKNYKLNHINNGGE